MVVAEPFVIYIAQFFSYFIVKFRSIARNHLSVIQVFCHYVKRRMATYIVRIAMKFYVLVLMTITRVFKFEVFTIVTGKQAIHIRMFLVFLNCGKGIYNTFTFR